MKKEDLLDAETIKKSVPKWVISLCATLMFLSVFINSIGLNLMQINGALTERIVTRIEDRPLLGDDSTLPEKEGGASEKISEGEPPNRGAEILEALEKRVVALEAIAHKPNETSLKKKKE